MRKITFILIFFFILLITAFGFFWKIYAPIQYQFIGMKGEVISSENLDDKLVLVNYWATWCPPCIREMPALSQFNQENPEAFVIGINYDRSEEGLVDNFLSQEPFNTLSYPIILQENNDLTQFGHISGLPTTFILHNNRLVETFAGELKEEDFQRFLTTYKKQ